MTTERSRAYPMLSLEESRLAIEGILGGLGTGWFSREVLGEALGHSNAYGGPGARKIAALSQFGLLRRKAGLYSPTPLAEQIRGSVPETHRGQVALRRALNQPPLFRALFNRYESQGRIPMQLAAVLWRDHGITRKASELAAEIFKQSARYAGALDRDGTLLEPERVPPQLMVTEARQQHLGSRPTQRSGPQRELRGESEQHFMFALTEGNVARVSLPSTLHKADLEIIKQQIQLIEHQVMERNQKHG